MPQSTRAIQRTHSVSEWKEFELAVLRETRWDTIDGFQVMLHLSTDESIKSFKEINNKLGISFQTLKGEAIAISESNKLTLSLMSETGTVLKLEDIELTGGFSFNLFVRRATCKAKVQLHSLHMRVVAEIEKQVNRRLSVPAATTASVAPHYHLICLTIFPVKRKVRDAAKTGKIPSKVDIGQSKEQRARYTPNNKDGTTAGKMPTNVHDTHCNAPVVLISTTDGDTTGKVPTNVDDVHSKKPVGLILTKDGIKTGKKSTDVDDVHSKDSLDLLFPKHGSLTGKKSTYIDDVHSKEPVDLVLTKDRIITGKKSTNVDDVHPNEPVNLFFTEDRIINDKKPTGVLDAHSHESVAFIPTKDGGIIVKKATRHYSSFHEPVKGMFTCSYVSARSPKCSEAHQHLKNGDNLEVYSERLFTQEGGELDVQILDKRKKKSPRVRNFLRAPVRSKRYFSRKSYVRLRGVGQAKENSPDKSDASRRDEF